MAKKPLTHGELFEAQYTDTHWQLLKTLRAEATRIMEILEAANLVPLTHGSIARGDVTHKSDIDIFITNSLSSFKIETTLERANIQINRRLIVQATPNYAVKGCIELGENRTISFTLAKMRRVEREFYRFGGEITLPTLKENRRIPGVDKRLMLIEPTNNGHIESSIVGKKEEAAKRLGVSLEVVLDRVHALLRRNEIGRTGVFIEKELAPDETFEMALKRLAETKPEVRRRLKFYKK